MRSQLPRRVPKPRSPKQCRKCHEWLPIECFDRKAGSPDFHSTECKACKGERKTPTRLVREEKLRAALRILLDAIRKNELQEKRHSEGFGSYNQDEFVATRKALKEARARAAGLVR